MSELFAVRNVDEKTKHFIYKYATENDVNIGEALREIVFLVQEHLKEKEQQKQKKKYSSLFDTYDKIAFTSDDPQLSEKIDTILYEEKQ